MKTLLAILFAMFASTAMATEITLTPAQVAKVVAENTQPPEPCPECPVCPPVDPEPPVDPPTPTVCRVTLTQGIQRNWSTLFGESFPGPRSRDIRIRIPTKGYYAVKFNTGGAQDTGYLGNFEASGTKGYRLGAVSKCAGDFNVPPLCKFKWSGGTGGIIWTTENAPSRCQLKANTVYYWNMTFTDGVDPESSRCIGSYCETYLQVSNR